MVWYSDKNKTAKQVVVGFCFFPFFFFFSSPFIAR